MSQANQLLGEMLGKIILVGSEKGGAGKTTTAFNLAEAITLAGEDAVIVDADNQSSATDWGRIRQEDPSLPHIPVVTLRGRIARDVLALAQKYRFVIVDAGGKDSVEIRQVAPIADLWIVPTKVAQLDVMSIATPLHICQSIEREAGVAPNARVLITEAPTLPSIQDANEFADLHSADEEYSKYLPLLKSRLCNRVAFRRSPSMGGGVISYATDAKAAAEVQELLAEVLDLLGVSTEESEA